MGFSNQGSGFRVQGSGFVVSGLYQEIKTELGTLNPEL
jgi:hypothetical protein